MWLFAALEIGLFTYSRIAGPDPSSDDAVAQQLFWIALSLGLAYLVARGNLTAFQLLFFLTALPLGLLLLSVARFEWYVVGLVAFTSAELTLLCAPALRRAPQPDGSEATAWGG